MVEHDTVKLLRECDAGIKMGVSSINDVLGYVHNEKLRQYLEESRSEHEDIRTDLEKLLVSYHDDGKEPNTMAKSMSWLKTNIKLTVNESDDVVADLITEGCNMGVKSLYKYLNKYQAADEKSKDITKRIIGVEEKLTANMRTYL
jgi:hypothetical protein